MPMNLTYLIGVPGAGKSTLMRAAVGDATRHLMVGKLPVMQYELPGPLHPVVAQLGEDRESFAGTDALSLGILPVALGMLPTLASAGWDLVAEGDRLATPKFWDAAARDGWNVRVVLVDVPASLAEERRALRGSSQSAAWLKGRHTKVEGQRSRADVIIDGTLPLPVQVHELRIIPPFDRWRS